MALTTAGTWTSSGAGTGAGDGDGEEAVTGNGRERGPGEETGGKNEVGVVAKSGAGDGGIEIIIKEHRERWGRLL